MVFSTLYQHFWSSYDVGICMQCNPSNVLQKLTSHANFFTLKFNQFAQISKNIVYGVFFTAGSDWSDEFQTIRKSDQGSGWANEFSEFTDTDFDTFLEGQKNNVVPAETAYTVCRFFFTDSRYIPFCQSAWSLKPGTG